ncbi:Cloroperoxidase [Xylaria nigripes]|nr:Cloroperoxidase [Xylaria nigripes]
MRCFTSLMLTTACAASPITTQPYVQPESTDSRSPCPMLNTLANHGYLPHNGRNITAQDIGNAIFESTNWHPDFGLVLANGTLQALGVSILDLSDLNSTAGGEHPASLTHKDVNPGDSVSVNASRIAAMLVDSRTNFLTIDSVARTRNRLDASSCPALTASQLAAAQNEASLMMLLMRDTSVSLQTNEEDPSTLRAPKDRVSAWLLEERFPTAQGWRPAEDIVQFTALGSINAALVASQVAQKGGF